MRPTAIVPVRVTPTAKRRLAHLLSPRERMTLVRVSLERVVDALRGAGLDVIALSPQPIEVPAGVDLWLDEAPGLNGAVARAIEKVGVPALIVHADLPDISADDVRVLLDTDADIVIARSRDGGTNALLLRAKIRPLYGDRSALAHAQLARRAGLRTIVVDRPGLAFDIDDGAALTVFTASSSRQPSSSRRPTP